MSDSSIKKETLQVTVDSSEGSVEEGFVVSSYADDDAAIQRAQGHEFEMPRHFSTLSLIALTFNITSTWCGMSASIGISLLDAGPIGAIWAFPVAIAFIALISLGMAELSSAFPSAGGQYHWSFMVSTPKYAPLAAFVCGWMASLAWWLAGASIANFCSVMVLSMANLWNPDYEIQKYQIYLLYAAFIIFAVSVNTFLAKWMPMINKLIMGLSMTSFLTIFIIMGAKHSSGFAKPEWVWSGQTNLTGWSSNGFAFILAIGNSFYGLLGTDAGAHLSEEIPHPGRNIPKTMYLTVILAFITAWPFSVMLVYVINDLDSVVNSGLPILEVYYQATGSKSAATALQTLMLLTFLGALIAAVETAGRNSWAFARDGGLPFSPFFAKINGVFQVPVNSMGLGAALQILYGLILMASNQAFNAVISALGLFMLNSYVMPQAILLWRGRKVLMPRSFDLGKFGFTINLISTVITWFFSIIFCFPTILPANAQNMNYVSVVTCGLMTLVMAFWFIVKRKTFTGPHLDLDLLNKLRAEALTI